MGPSIERWNRSSAHTRMAQTRPARASTSIWLGVARTLAADSTSSYTTGLVAADLQPAEWTPGMQAIRDKEA